MKRQEPGTPAYNCHDNCGTAITISKSGSDVCSNEAFLTNYQNCIQCSGPDNENIWRYYGGTLGPIGSECGLESEPLSGEQEDVGPAIHPGASSSTTAEPTPTVSMSTTVAPALTSDELASSDVETATPAPTYVDTVISSVVGTITSASGIPSPSGNGTAIFTSSPPQQTTNAATHFKIGARMLGAIVLGIMYDLGS
ncbi:hypothetical protein CC78DRAFT_537263 [Lojkania enalia]|uniref:Uncharacterized protein n=1 Tax=Lojkania enalia TaxID=147567 RepID=A0A9P4JZ93_9PLEO|nr:hypothetical protein CC78DRAFT_537263 [Didymosphaeria enalia]